MQTEKHVDVAWNHKLEICRVRLEAGLRSYAADSLST